MTLAKGSTDIEDALAALRKPERPGYESESTFTVLGSKITAEEDERGHGGRPGPVGDGEGSPAEEPEG